MHKRMSFDRDVDLAGAGAGDSAGQASDAGAPAKLPSSEAINQLFAPPSYNETGTFYQTIEKALAEKKWVLVNIQQAEVFASHTLNRDVWRDETIQDVVLGSFLFWQRDDKSTEGDQFCQYYQCGHQLPHICVIDPRTGRRVKAWDGRKWTESHAAAEYLFAFLDGFSMSTSPPALSPVGSPALQPQASPSAGESRTGDMQLSGFDNDAAAAASAFAEASLPPAVEVPEQAKEPVSTMPEEPPDTEEHLKVSFRLPAGQRVTRRFRPTEPLEVMFAVASALTEQPTSVIDLSTQFPKRSLRDIEGGLQASMKDAQVAGNMILVNVRSA